MGWPYGYGKKEGDMLADCRRKMHHQIMRLSVVNAACSARCLVELKKRMTGC